MSNAESYETESGLLTHYVGTVQDAWFGPHDKFNSYGLFMKNGTDDSGIPEITEFFSTGDKWRSYDGGKTVVNVDDENRVKFHENSRMGTLVNRCVKELGMLDVLVARGPAQHASTWIGLSFEWDQFLGREYDLVDEQTGEKKKGQSKYNLPVRYVGEGAVVAAPAAGPATSALEGVGDELIAQLREARASAGTQTEFVDKAIGLTGVVGNDSLVRAIADPDGLWKELA